jgi:5-methyltetrahydropteroyltriglutamate--homocysteine methyltransferase
MAKSEVIGSLLRPPYLADAREDGLKRRIADAARIVSMDRLALSPQCGFASTMEGNKLTPEEQRAKLELVGRVARSVFG